MEEMVILLAEFISTPILMFGAVIIEFIISVFWIIGVVFGTLFWMLTGKNHEGSKKYKTPSKHISTFTNISASPKIKLVLQAVKRVALVGFVFIIAILCIINFAFFAPSIRWVAGNVSTATGIEIEFSAVDGNIFTGHINFTNLKVKQIKENKTNFDLTLENAEIDLDVPSLLLRPIIFEKMNISGVSGNIKQPPKSNITNQHNNTKEPKKTRHKRDFIIDDLKFNNINASLTKGENPPVNILLENIISQPFRSNYAIFDIFFRSNITGKIDGHAVSISTEKTGSGRKTRWTIESLPVKTVSNFVDKAPISWLQDGIIDIAVEDEWQLGKAPDINMDWQFNMHDMRVAVPENSAKLEQIIAIPIANYINSREGDVNLRLKFTMNEKQFEGVTSLDAAGLWDALIIGITKSIPKNSVLQAPEVKKKIRDELKNLKGSFGHDK